MIPAGQDPGTGPALGRTGPPPPFWSRACAGGMWWELPPETPDSGPASWPRVLSANSHKAVIAGALRQGEQRQSCTLWGPYTSTLVLQALLGLPALRCCQRLHSPRVGWGRLCCEPVNQAQSPGVLGLAAGLCPAGQGASRPQSACQSRLISLQLRCALPGRHVWGQVPAPLPSMHQRALRPGVWGVRLPGWVLGQQVRARGTWAEPARPHRASPISLSPHSCNETCQDGFFGVNCSSPCPCAGGPCHPLSGDCALSE